MAALHAIVDRLAERHVDRVAIRFEGRSTTYGELARSAGSLAHEFAALGMGRATRVGLLMGNRPEWLVSALAAWRIGAVVFPLSTFLREGELEAQLRRSAVEAVVFSPQFSGMRYDEILADLAAGGRLPELLCRIAWPRDAARPRVIGRVRARSPVPPDDRAIVFFTSGSTGEPKGVIHDHAPIVRHARAVAARMGIGPDDRSWSTFPFFFSAGAMIFAAPALVSGATLVLQERFEPDEGLRLLERERCTVYQAWPHQVEAMMAERAFRDADLRSVTKSNGARFLPHEAFLRHSHQAIDGWGMTETLTYCCSTFSTDSLEVRLASHGKPFDGVEVRIVDPGTRAVLRTGNEGELCVRGYNLTRGYLDQRDSHVDEDGFFHSGDLGRSDEAGNVHFLGRLKEIIKTAGVNVAAVEIENLLGSHSAVESAHVVGVPDPSRGELIVAFVVRSAPCEERELAEFVAERTARYKTPRWIFFLDRAELPQTGTGKILKTRLREIAIERTRR